MDKLAAGHSIASREQVDIIFTAQWSKYSLNVSKGVPGSGSESPDKWGRFEQFIEGAVVSPGLGFIFDGEVVARKSQP